MQSRQPYKYNMITSDYSLPIEAFRVSMLSGTLPTPVQAGSYNIPPKAQPTQHVTQSLGVIPKIDYLTVMFLTGDISVAVNLIEKNSSCFFAFEDLIVQNVNHTEWIVIKGSRGARFEYRKIPGIGYKCRLSLGGVACNCLTLTEIGTLMLVCSQFAEYSCTRFDYNADDINGILPLGTIAARLRDRQYVGYNCGEVVESFGGKTAGMTVYFGGRKSLQRVRFYDKEAESGIEGAGVRHEVQCRGGRAQEMFEALKGKESLEICQFLAGKLRGSIRFGQRGIRNAQRIKVDDFWKEWGAVLSQPTIAKVPLCRKKSLTRTIGWMKRSVSKAMAKLTVALEIKTVGEFCAHLYETAIDKLTKADYADIAHWQQEGGEEGLDDLFSRSWYDMEVVTV